MNLVQRGAALTVLTEGDMCDSGSRKGLLCGGPSVLTFIIPGYPWHSLAAKSSQEVFMWFNLFTKNVTGGEGGKYSF